MTDQSPAIDLISRTVPSTCRALVPKGTVPFTLASRGVRSKSSGPPVQTSGSFSGSSPMNENSHLFFAKSTLMNRSLPGQFESSTRTIAVLSSGNSTAYGRTACPPIGPYTPAVNLADAPSGNRASSLSPVVGDGAVSSPLNESVSALSFSSKDFFAHLSVSV